MKRGAPESRALRPHRHQHGATFLGVRCDPTLAAKTVEVASKDWMAAHESKFDDHWLSERQAACGTAPRKVPPSTKVVAGAHANRLSESARAMLLERWESQVAPLTGCKSYEEMAAGLRELRAQRRYEASWSKQVCVRSPARS